MSTRKTFLDPVLAMVFIVLAAAVVIAAAVLAFDHSAGPVQSSTELTTGS